MPNFEFVARDPSGRKVTKIRQAGAREEIVSSLQADGYIVLSIRLIEEYTSFKPKKVVVVRRFAHSRIKEIDMVQFAKQLSVVLGSGITLTRGLHLLLRQTESQKLHSVIELILKDVESGMVLKSALAKYPRIFSPLWVNLVEAGEASGNLAFVLERLSFYLERAYAFRSKVINALMYPAILACLAVLVVTFFMLKIIPTFIKIFEGFNIKLPLITRIMIGISANFKVIFLIVVGLVVAGFVLAKQFKKSAAIQKYIDYLSFKLPVFGEFFQLVCIERFASEISILIEAGVPLLYALEITEKSSGNKVMEEVLGNIKNNLREGRSLSKLLDESGFFTPLIVQMVLVGEETGELPTMLKKVSAYYQDYMDNFATRFVALFEPALIIFMGGIIGTIVVSMFLPIMSLATGIKQ